MRLWHHKLINKLDNQRLLGQHRECCALRGKGWGRKHSTVDYVFDHPYDMLVMYHRLVMNEMIIRWYKPDSIWWTYKYRGKNIGWVEYENLPNNDKQIHNYYPEHNKKYLKECNKILLEKNYEYYKEKL